MLTEKKAVKKGRREQMTGAKLISLASASLVMAMVFAELSALGQQGPARGKLTPTRDAEQETAANHNLQVARYYFLKRKAYQGARDRLREIMDTYPEFSRLDEVLFLLGESDFKLGKKDEAAKALSRLVKEFPDSEFYKKGKERLTELQENSAGAAEKKNGGAQ
jgi:TolA-binding protein